VLPGGFFVTGQRQFFWEGHPTAFWGGGLQISENPVTSSLVFAADVLRQSYSGRQSWLLSSIGGQVPDDGILPAVVR